MSLIKNYSFLTYLLLVSCASPSVKFSEEALDYGFSSLEISSEAFQHRIYLNSFVRDKLDSTTLHVYLDGDGTPWVKNQWIAKDPTARNPLILRLMKVDKKPAILLGRPCYYGMNQSIACESKYWTSHRYSSEVVKSMASVLKSWLLINKYTNIVFIGFSGGGVLAVLLANEINQTTKVVTVSANLDVAAWSEFHGYRALEDSLNPMKQIALKESIQQFHFAGEDDKVVPTFIIKKYVESQKEALFYEVEGQGHVCCWDGIWATILWKIGELRE